MAESHLDLENKSFSPEREPEWPISALLHIFSQVGRGNEWKVQGKEVVIGPRAGWKKQDR